jgi:hypothetical protein
MSGSSPVFEILWSEEGVVESIVMIEERAFIQLLYTAWSTNRITVIKHVLGADVLCAEHVSHMSNQLTAG